MPNPVLVLGRAPRVVVCDDSTFVRVALRKVLAAAGVEIVRECRDGAEAVAAAAELKPDLVLMDIEMPVMNGLEATRLIMERSPTRVLVLSSLARKGRVEAIKAIRAGAIDVMVKPEAADFATLKDEVIAKVALVLEAHTHARVTPGGAAATIAPSGPSAEIRVGTGATAGGQVTPGTFDPRRRLAIDVVAIGTSTGGPGSLARVLSALPASFPHPILVVQHMPPGWTETLAEQLASSCALKVREARDDEFAEAGTVFIAPGDRHLELAPARRIRVHEGPHDGGFRPAVNTLFRSVARCSRGRCLGIVLTGMGTDGTEGARAIRDAGGSVIAESKETCVLYGMPRSVIEAGLASAALPLPEIASCLALQAS